MSSSDYLDYAVDGLLQAAADRTEQVQNAVISAFRQHSNIAGRHVLLRCKAYLETQKRDPSNLHHRFVLYTAMCELIPSMAQMETSVLCDVVRFVLDDMKQSKDVYDSSGLAAGRLVEHLCQKAPQETLRTILDTFPSNNLPHLLVIGTLGNFAASYPLYILPVLKEVFAKIIPLLALVKTEAARQVFAEAFGHFADAILQLHHLNSEHPLTPRSSLCATMRPIDFCDSAYTIFHVLISEWNVVKEIKPRIAVAKAIAFVASVLSPDQLRNGFSRVLNHLLQALRREKIRDSYPLLKSLSALLSVCGDMILNTDANHFECLFLVLLRLQVHSMSENKGDIEEDPVLIRLQYILCECIEYMTMIDAHTMIAHIQKQLQCSAPRQGNNSVAGETREIRVAALVNFLRHIISRKNLDDKMDPLKDNMVTTIKTLEKEIDWAIRRVVVQAITTMGGSSDVRYFTCSGAPDLVHYLILHASLSTKAISEWRQKYPKGAPPELVDPAEVRSTARTALALFSSDASTHLDHHLWPSLLDHLNEHKSNPSLLSSFPTICSALQKILSRVALTDRFYIDFSVEVNTPRPPQLVAKFLVMLTEHSSAEVILNVMERLAPVLDDPYQFGNEEGECPMPIAKLWIEVIPEMRVVLHQGEGGEGVQADGSGQEGKDWEQCVLRLMSKTCTCRMEEEWVEGICDALVEQIVAYEEFPELMRVSLAMIGISAARCAKKEYVSMRIENLAQLANHNLSEHRDGVSRAYSYLVAPYCDLILDFLANNLVKPTSAQNEKGRSLTASSVFVLKKDPSIRPFQDITRSLAARCFGSAMRKIPPQSFASRVDTLLIPAAQDMLTATKLQEVRLDVLEMMAKFYIPIQKLGDTFHFRNRDVMIQTILSLLETPGKVSLLELLNLYRAGFQALNLLIEACPTPQVAASKISCILQTVIHFVNKVWNMEANKEQVPRENIELEQDCLQRAAELMCTIMQHQHPEDLMSIVTNIEPLTRAPTQMQRERAMVLFLALAKHQQRRIESMLNTRQDSDDPEHTSSHVQVHFIPGALFACLVPRICDASALVRKTAAELMLILFRIYFATNTGQDTTTESEALVRDARNLRRKVDALVDIQDRDHYEKELASIIKNYCVSIVTALPTPAQFQPLLTHLLQCGILDASSDESMYASCVVMHGAVRGLCHILGESEQITLLELMIIDVDLLIKNEARDRTLNSLLVSVRNLCKHNSKIVFERLLQYPAPQSHNVVLAIQAICNDTSLSQAFLQHCSDTIFHTQLIEEHLLDSKKKGPIQRQRTLNPLPLSAVVTIGWICKTEKGQEAARSMRIPLLSSILLYIGTAQEMEAMFELPLVVDALEKFTSSTMSGVTRKRISTLYGSLGVVSSQFTLAIGAYVQYVIRDSMASVNGTALSPASEAVQSNKSVNEGVSRNKVTEKQSSLPEQKLVPEEDANSATKAQSSWNDESCEDGFDQNMPRGPLGNPELPPTATTPVAKELLAFIVPYASKPISAHRRVAIAMLAELLKQCRGDPNLVNTTVQTLLGRCVEGEERDNQKYAATYLRYLGDHDLQFVTPLITTVVSVLLANSSEVCVMQSYLQSIAYLLDHFECPETLGTLCVNITCRVKTNVDHPDERIRSASLDIITSVFLRANQGVLEAETLHSFHISTFPAVLLHIEDMEVSVRQSAKKCFEQMVHYTKKYIPVAPNNNNYIKDDSTLVPQECMQEKEDPLDMDFTRVLRNVHVTTRTNWDDFCNEFGKTYTQLYTHCTTDFLMSVENYFQSPWSTIRAAAAVLMGFIVQHLPNDAVKRVNMQQATQSLASMVHCSREREAFVRAKAVRALSMFSSKSS